MVPEAVCATRCGGGEVGRGAGGGVVRPMRWLCDVRDNQFAVCAGKSPHRVTWHHLPEEFLSPRDSSMAAAGADGLAALQGLGAAAAAVGAGLDGPHSDDEEVQSAASEALDAYGNIMPPAPIPETAADAAAAVAAAAAPAAATKPTYGRFGGAGCHRRGSRPNHRPSDRASTGSFSPAARNVKELREALGGAGRRREDDGSHWAHAW